LEIPEDMQKKNDFAPLGAADGPVKTAIFSGNAARLYDFEVDAVIGDISADQISALKVEYLALNSGRSNLRFGYIHKA
jgi:hypothetical protein